MDHKMVLSYDYSSQNRRQRRTNVNPSQAISMAMAVRRCDKQSALPDAAWPGLHRKPLDAAIGQLLAPYCPGGCQGDNQHNNNGACTHFAGSFDGHRDATTTKCHHRASTVVSNISSWKRAPVDILAPNNKRGMTYQTDEKHLNCFQKSGLEGFQQMAAF